VEPGIIPSGYERTLPPEVQLLVRARRRRLVGRATGRVLDLGGSGTHQGLWAGVPGADEVLVLDGGDDARLTDLAGGSTRFDTVLSVFQLAATADLRATLELIRQVLDGEGRLLFLEPARLVGAGSRVQSVLAPAYGTLAGWRPDRDIPMELRAAGLSVTDVRRHRATTLQWWVRRLVEGTAHHALEPARREV
jgi:hypothetical protein